jgi:hypothetical protein
LGITALLDGIARDHGACIWVGADYHVECDYQFLWQKVPGLRIIVAVRDPVEAVAASLYWRTFPRRAAGAQCEMAMRVALWKMSVSIALYLAARYPRDVLLLDMNKVWSGREDSIGRLASFIDCETAQAQKVFISEPWFCKNSTDEFLCPDGERRTLLTAEEIMNIERATASLRRSMCRGTGTLRSWQRLAGRFPRTARNLISFRYRPRQRIKRGVSIFWRAVRLAVTY